MNPMSFVVGGVLAGLSVSVAFLLTGHSPIGSLMVAGGWAVFGLGYVIGRSNAAPAKRAAMK